MRLAHAIAAALLKFPYQEKESERGRDNFIGLHVHAANLFGIEVVGKLDIEGPDAVRGKGPRLMGGAGAFGPLKERICYFLPGGKSSFFGPGYPRLFARNIAEEYGFARGAMSNACCGGEEGVSCFFWL